MKRVIIADESDLFVQGARLVLESERDIEIVATCDSADPLLAALQPDSADILILSEGLDPDTDILSLVSQFHAAAPNMHLIVVGAFHDGLLVRDLLLMGVSGYLYRADLLAECLITAINTVMNRRLYLSATANAEYLLTVQSAEHNWRLDSEALAVLRLLVRGCSVGSIAAELSVKPRRIYWVREKLRRRFGATTNEHLISRAAAEGFAYPID